MVGLDTQLTRVRGLNSALTSLGPQRFTFGTGSLGPIVFPLPAGTKIFYAGNSFVQHGGFSINASGNLLGGLATYSINAVQLVARQDARFNSDVFYNANYPYAASSNNNQVDGANQGLNGRLLIDFNGLPGLITALPYALARAAGQTSIFVIDCLTNDNTAGRTAAQIIANLQTVISMIKAARHVVIIRTMTWSLAWTPGSQQETTMNTVNAFIEALPDLDDPQIDCLNTAAIDGITTIPSNYLNSSDLVHPLNALVWQWGTLLLPKLQALVSPAPDPTIGIASASNLFPQRGFNSGSAGTVGAGTTGIVLTGLNMFRQVGTSTYVASVVPLSGENAQQLVVTPVNDGTAIHQYQVRLSANLSLATLGLSVGDWVQVLLPVTLDNWSGWQVSNNTFATAPAQISMKQGNASAQSIWESDDTAATPGTTFNLSVKFQIQSGATQILANAPPFNLLHYSNTGGTGTISFRSFYIKKLATDPQAKFNLPIAA